MVRKSMFVGVIAVAMAVALAGCTSATAPSGGSTKPASAADGNPSAKLVAAAKAEGTVTWYTTVPPAPAAALAAAFTAQYGIQVTVNRQGSAAIGPLVSGEITGKKITADVVETGDPTIVQGFSDKGWLTVQNKKSLPILATWPTQWIYGASVYPQAIAPYGISYNTDLVTTAPKSWDVLLDSKYSSKIFTLDPRANTGGLDIIRVLKNTFGEDWVKKLAAQKLQFNASLVNTANSLAAGDAAIYFPGVRWIDSDLINKGAPIKEVYPKPSVGGSEQWVGQIKGSPHPNAAELFLNYALSPAGQTATCKDQCASVINAPGTIPLPSDYKSPNLHFTDSEKASLIALIGL